MNTEFLSEFPLPDSILVRIRLRASLSSNSTGAAAPLPSMRDPLMPINAQEDPKAAADAGSEKQALCISIATLILSVPALIGA